MYFEEMQRGFIFYYSHELKSIFTRLWQEKANVQNKRSLFLFK